MLPIAPGTWGSLGALVVAYGIDQWVGLPWWGLLVGAFLAGAVNVALGPWIERHFGRKDPGAVVVDECAGQWLTLVPVVGADLPVDSWVAFVMAFGIFRLLDITKPLGARRLEKLPHGWGILMDDVLCGVYGAVLLALFRWLS